MSEQNRFVCSFDGCNKSFTRKFSLRQHQRRVHETEVPVERCHFCGQIFANCNELQEHYITAHPPSRRFIIRESAFRRKFTTYRYNFLPNQTDFPLAQKSIKNLIIRQIMTEAAKKIMTRVALIFIAEMIADDYSGERVQNAIISFRAPTFFANGSNPTELEKLVRQSFSNQLKHLDEFMRSGSNWRFNRAIAFDIEISAVNPIRGGCQTIQMKKWQNSKHVYNPQSKNNRCFLYCIAYFLLFGLTFNKNQLTLEMEAEIHKKSRTLNTKGLVFPLAVTDIKKFLSRNADLNISINVLCRTTDDEIYPLEYRLGEGTKIITLLLVTSKSGGHFMLITNPDFYLRKVYNTKSKLRYKGSFFCLNCFSSFLSTKVRDKHVEICMLNKPRREKTPEIGKDWVFFRHKERQHWLDYIAYLDFECVLPSAHDICQICLTLKCKCENQSATKILNNQIPICYSFVVIDANDKIIHEHSFIGKDAHINFLEHLIKQEDEWISDLLEEKKPLQMSFKDTMQYNNSDICYLCKQEFTDQFTKCRDHCHFTGKYLGAACQKCNLSRRQQGKLKIFIHNASKYDMHFLIKALPNVRNKVKDIKILPYNGENFRTMSFNHFEILDSLSFLQAPLSQLANDLKLSGHTYNLLKQTYLVREKGSFSKKRMEMVLAKSFFPYEYCKSYQKMKETTHLPKIKNFYSKLTGKSISRDEHAFARKIWKMFKCKNLLDYCKLYCKIDVILLAEIFQKFRSEMKQFSGLDPAHYISLPAFGYDSMLFITGANIQLPSCIEIVHFLERAKRGGVSFINTRYLSVPEDNEGEEEEEEIIYIDANNLYGNAQLQKLPIRDFRWLSEEEMLKFDLFQDTEGPKGYFVECDIHYPSFLHEKHSNFPLCPEILEVTYDNLSPYTKMAIEKTEGRKKYSDVKLMSTFHDKLNYVTHLKNLQLYVSLGLAIMKVHRILEFTQDNLLQPFIERTTAARQRAPSKFQSDLYKKLVNI